MRRVLSVHFAPCALFVAGVVALARAGSFAGRSDWRNVWPQRPEATVGLVLLVVVCAALLGLLLQPFQVRAVRVLEGYWGRWPVTAALAGVLTEVQRRRWEALRESAAAPASGAVATSVRADRARRLSARPPAHVLLPTALGNALRAGEIRAGERYGLSTLASWPRIYMQVSDRMADALRSTREALDAATNLCWCFLALSVISAAAFYDEPGLWWLCGCGLLLAAVAYKGAITAAQTYSGLMHVVYDLHRFDLVEALHLRLPDDPDDEEELFTQLSDLFAGRGKPDLRYDHRAGLPRADHTDGSADAEHMGREPR
ncbi:hypothetical protein [Streptomyces griseorubiginosus]|uniref:hypothetical protein n=1 Tax=Streptomyces griseorubiginosus TaxID=67304 RepID=UPI002E8055BA|nr:hypothetical protein [Streptomyces griseorubiginosus]WUB44777.1 hypothetical protein OHN19_16105 [Streptomyces griseorubiginosus]WUB53294.1 hypothetical protein OG942_16100 [Streptomyces griseorubiginosus]